jgi:transcriptional regulator with XRE-family HTH domain
MSKKYPLLTQRRSMGLTQEAFGKLIGMSQERLSHLERGRGLPSSKALRRIRSVFPDISLEALLRIEPASRKAGE